MAYNKPFLGKAAEILIQSLRDYDHEIQHKNEPAYAKAISVLQSSGTGKSRMLTEVSPYSIGGHHLTSRYQVGRHTFTLPICLRHPNSPGYPLSDEEVHCYFGRITTNNDMSLTAHSAIARFLTAAHETMLKWLKEAQQKNNFNAEALHTWWYNVMERKVGQQERRKFFSEVLGKAKDVSHRFLMFQRLHCCSQIKIGPERPGNSPKRPEDKNAPHVYDIVDTSQKYYEGARVAVETLMAFLDSLYPGERPLCVTYFDEAHELQLLFWILLRLLSHQPTTIKMWYVFMGTKSSISYFTPPPGDSMSSNISPMLISH